MKPWALLESWNLRIVRGFHYISGLSLTGVSSGSLSEMAVLGVRYSQHGHCVILTTLQFEYGASWERPNLLAIWEAQVGVVVLGTH